MSLSATVSGSDWINSLTDSGIAADVRAATVSGSLSYGGALHILQDVASAVSSTGALTAAQFDSLQTVAANLNNGIVTSDDVASLFTQLVDGSPANATWTAGTASATPLGNLQIGSGASQINELIGKWLLGTDLPNPAAQGATSSSTITPTYHAVTTLPLFASGGPAVSDINQGDVGDCELCAGLIEVVTNAPGDISSMIVPESNGVYGVRFYVGGKTLWVAVNDQLPYYQGSLLFNQGPSLWADLVEKAYAEVSATGLIQQAPVNSYANINADPAFEVLENLTNCTDVSYYFSNDPDWIGFKSIFIGAIAAKDDLILESNGNTTDRSGNKQLISDHAFAVIGYDSSTGDFIVRNPWGNEGAGQGYDTQFEISMADIVTVGGDIVIDNLANRNILMTTLGQITSLGQTNSNGAFIADGQYVTAGGSVPITALFSSVDVAGLPILDYRLQSIGTGTVALNGATNLASAAQQSQGQIEVSAGDLSKLSYLAGSGTGGTDLLISAYDGVAWSTPTDIALTITAQPVTVVPSLSLAMAPTASHSVASFFKVAGLSAGGNYSYQITVEGDSGSLQLNGGTNQLSRGDPWHVEVSAADLSLLTYTAPASVPTTNNGEVFLDVTVYQGATAVSDQTQLPVGIGTTAAAALQSFNANQVGVWIPIVDSAANVGANLDGLESMMTAADILSITLTDGGIPTVSITPQQVTADAAVLDVIQGDFSVLITVGNGDPTITGIANALGNTVAFGDTASHYVLTSSGDGSDFSVSDGGVTDQMSDVQALKFSDYTVIVAPAPGSGGTVTGGNVTELYGAAFGREPDVAGLAYYEKELAANPGLALTSLALDFLQSPEYGAAHHYAQSSAGDAQFITDLYNNLLHRAPESAAIPYYQAIIAQFTGALTPGSAAYQTALLQGHAAVLVDVSASSEFLSDVQITAQHPADSSHWLFLI